MTLIISDGTYPPTFLLRLGCPFILLGFGSLRIFRRTGPFHVPSSAFTLSLRTPHVMSSTNAAVRIIHTFSCGMIGIASFAPKTNFLVFVGELLLLPDL